MRAVQADYLTPFGRASDVNCATHVFAYTASMVQPLMPPRRNAQPASFVATTAELNAAAQLQPLQQALFLCTMEPSQVPSQLLASFEAARAAIELLEQPATRSSIDRQLAVLQAGAQPLGKPPVPPLTAARLLYLAHCNACLSAAGLASTVIHEPPTVANRVRRLVGATVPLSCWAVERLEPDNLRGLVRAASVACAMGCRELGGVRMLGRAQHLAREQRSDFYAAYAASVVASDLLQAEQAGQLSPPAIRGAAREAVQQAEAALARCKKVLPDAWLWAVEGYIIPPKELLQHAPSLQGVETAVSAQVTVCSGCGMRAVGLRRCARCRQAGASYCRRAGPEMVAWGPGTGPAWHRLSEGPRLVVNHASAPARLVPYPHHRIPARPLARPSLPLSFPLP